MITREQVAQRIASQLVYQKGFMQFSEAQLVGILLHGAKIGELISIERKFFVETSTLSNNEEDELENRNSLKDCGI